MAPSFVWLNFRVCCRCACSTTAPKSGVVGDPGPPPHRAKRALGTPGLHPTARSARWGPRAYGVWNCSDVPLTQALSLIALCATRERTWANFFRA